MNTFRIKIDGVVVKTGTKEQCMEVLCYAPVAARGWVLEIKATDGPGWLQYDWGKF